MAKPSVTNIKPPSKTAVWVPPKTTWDLNDTNDIAAAGTSYAAEGTPQYDTLTDSINVPAPEAVDFGFDDYDYVFFGVNGGENETVRAMDTKAGVIVTGNGKDVITGERWVLNSDTTGKTVVYEAPADPALYTYKSAGEMLVFAGNGMDYVHGGAANDILFGENGPDTLNGGADEGTANFIEPDDGQIINPDHIFIWEDDPTGTSVARETSDNTLRKEGVFIDDNDVIHTVYSYSPDEAGVHTIAYYKNGTTLDGPGDPDPDYFTTENLVVGQKYYYSFVGDGDTVHVNVFVGEVDPPPTGPQGQWPVDPIPTSQAIPTDYDITIIDGGNGTASFTAGDQLIGGNGPDQFVWDAADSNNVDLIWDYNQGDGGAVDPLEGDTLLLIGVTDTNADNVVDTSDLTTFLFDVDGDDTTPDALVIYVGENQAIGLAGITDINQVNVLFG